MGILVKALVVASILVTSISIIFASSVAFGFAGCVVSTVLMPSLGGAALKIVGV